MLDIYLRHCFKLYLTYNVLWARDLYFKIKFHVLIIDIVIIRILGAQWLSGRVLDLRPKGHGFEPHQRHCVVVLEQDTFILA